MTITKIISFSALFCGIAGPGLACSIVSNDNSPRQIRSKSRPVAVDRQCRTINIGVYDFDSLGAVQNVGKGRIVQWLNDQDGSALVADCNTREATILQTPVTSYVGDGGTCGPHAVFASLTNETNPFALEDGANLNELEQTAKAAGATVRNPINTFFRFEIGASSRGFRDTYDVGRDDQFNLLCGCDRYYPNSAGASQ